MWYMIIGRRLESVIGSNFWMLAHEAADLVSHSLCWGLPEVPGVGWLSHHHHCQSTSDLEDRAEVHIKMGMKGLNDDKRL